jgi:molecular chaperone DnaJ
MSTSRDYYEILGVTKDADGDAIKKAYRKAAMQFHPDKNPGDQEAENKFKEAAEAYEVLSNSEKRSQYDRFGHAAFKGGRSQPGFQDMDDIFANFGDIFSDFFGGGSSQRSTRRGGPRRGADLRYVTEISLKDVIEGIDREIEFDIDDDCEKCHGTGAEKGSTPVTCPTCGGRGQVVRAQGFFSMASTCPQCNGEGQIIKDPCKSCKGKGRVKSHRKINLTIPPGVDTGTRLRVANEGEGGFRGGPAGDLYVEVAVKDDARFERDGNDLIGNIEVDYLQMLLGAELEVETVTNTLKVQLEPHSQIGDTLKVSGEGVPMLRGSRRGDLYLRVAVKFPKKLSTEEQKLLQQAAEIRGVPAGKTGSKPWFSAKKNK